MRNKLAFVIGFFFSVTMFGYCQTAKDTTPPELNLKSPLDISYYDFKTELVIEYSCKDKGGIDKAATKVELDGVPVESLKYTKTTNKNTTCIKVAGGQISSGAHKLMVQVQDWSANKTQRSATFQASSDLITLLYQLNLETGSNSPLKLAVK